MEKITNLEQYNLSNRDKEMLEIKDDRLEIKKQTKEINEYEKSVPIEEVENFINEIKSKIVGKTKKFGISEKELLELSRLSDIDPRLSGLDQRLKENEFFRELEKKSKEINVSSEKLEKLTSFNLETLNDLKTSDLKRGDFEFYKKDFNDYFKSIDTKDNLSLSTEFIKKHKNKISLAQLGLYLSAFGSPILKELSENHIQIDVNGEKISPDDLAKNPDLLKKIQVSVDKHMEIGAEKEIPSKKITEIYEKVKDSPDKESKYENLTGKIEEAGKFLKYAELIKNGEKENLNKLSSDLDQKGVDTILFGEYHGPESNAINAVKILEKLQEKNNKKISKIGLEFLKFNDPKDIELTEKFNNKEISAEDFYSKGYFRSDIRPLLEFAQKNNIPIAGLEDEKNFGNPTDMKRFTEISHKVGEMSKDKKNNEIVAVFIGQRHTTESNFGLDNPIFSDYKENRKDAIAKDYTIKEYLEKLGFNPAAINLDEWSEFAKASDEYFGNSYNKLEEKNKDVFGEYAIKNWNKYKLDQKETFVINHGEGSNTYSVVNFSETPANPPSLTVFKSIKEKYPQLEEIIHKKNVFTTYGYGQLTLEYNNDKIKIAHLDPDAGNIKEIFLPQEDYNKSSIEKMKNIDKFSFNEKLREILTTYDPKLHQREQEIDTEN